MNNLENRITKLETQIQSISINQFISEDIEETTANVADTKRLVAHGLGMEPKGFIIVFGNVYVKDFTDKYVDVRSAVTSEKFKIKLLK